MTPVEYPSAERHSCGYAVRYMRWLYESGTAAEVGPDAMAVLGAVLTLEDAFHYRRPPNFFNAQLMDRCGFRSEHAFIRARQIAIDAGLLHYEGGKKRTPGRYWVCGFTAQSAGEAGRKPGESQTKAGPSIPRPNNPDPKEGAASGESPSKGKNGKTKTPRFDPLSIEIPEPLRTERFRQAWREWCQHRREIRKPLTPTATSRQLSTLAAWGERRAVRGIEHTVAMGWTGLREPDGDRNGAVTTTASPAPERRPVTLRELREAGEGPR